MSNITIQKNETTNSEVAIFSDLHLGLYADSEKWLKNALNWAEWTKGQLEERNIDTIFFLGDFFHNRTDVSVSTIHTGSQILEIFKNFTIYVIVGNHDAWYKNRSDVHSLGMMRNWNNIELIDEPKMYDICGHTCNFVPWGHEVEDDSEFLFGHFEVTTFSMNGYTTCTHGVAPTHLLSHSSNVYSGHFHTKSIKKYKQGDIRYVGNTFPMDFSDEGDIKGVYILDLDTAEVEFIENDVSPRFKKFIINDADFKFDEEDVENNIIKLIFDSGLSEKEVLAIKTNAATLKPFIIDYDYSTVVVNMGTGDEIDLTFDLYDVMEEFVDIMDLSDDIKEKSKKKLKKLYEKNSI
jgi:DNA repair exonuclease SbcCD nuclease subunit